MNRPAFIMNISVNHRIPVGPVLTGMKYFRPSAKSNIISRNKFNPRLEVYRMFTPDRSDVRLLEVFVSPLQFQSPISTGSENSLR
uniref:Uncharacterized protein n=1 Tax=Onchocerca volvulus TaxID=6282 RepID=A0A8R1XWC8_ONCVO